MTEQNTHGCRCDNCGKEFNCSESIEVDGTPEYHGASTWKESVSPCCHADYEEIYED